MNQRLQLHLTGLLQGMGFRPFVYRLAVHLHLVGWVANADDGVVLEIQGESGALQVFIQRLQTELPAPAYIERLQQTPIALTADTHFYFAKSRTSQQATQFACPDIAPCADCLTELFNPRYRRYRYPFISCCHCGPRYSIMTRLPYDRIHTSMQGFTLCADCLAEYHNPNDRRFFAQTQACSVCGPHLQFCDVTGRVLAEHDFALQTAITALQAGHIIALKGIGGFQLLALARDYSAVQTLRQRKHRASKPFAVMVQDLTQAEHYCILTELERASLRSASRPIVLAEKRQGINDIAENIAPQQTLLGIMLPSSPLHYLLLEALHQPIVATSGNRHDEPICIDNNQALSQLAGIADGFLVHNRPIVRALDDSIVRVIANKTTLFRRARGFVPTPLKINTLLPASLAVGGQQKNTLAIAQNGAIIVSQHIGDLHNSANAQQHQRVRDDLLDFFQHRPQVVVSDWHQDYASTRHAEQLNLPILSVQHHYAHCLAVMAEHQLPPPVLGIAWDGTGLGEQNQLWGGEFLKITHTGFERVASCRPLPLIGGAQAIKEPRRALLGLLYASVGDAVFDDYRALLSAFNEQELSVFRAMLNKNIQCPLTSSMGRIFDAFASLLQLCQINEYEGQAAIYLEQAAIPHYNDNTIIKLIQTEPLLLDWRDLVADIINNLTTLSINQLSAKIHYQLARGLLAIADEIDLKTLVLSGGCFQNAYLVKLIQQLNTHYTIYQAQQIPPNDGGLAVGQLYALSFKK